MEVDVASIVSVLKGTGILALVICLAITTIIIFWLIRMNGKLVDVAFKSHNAIKELQIIVEIAGSNISEIIRSNKKMVKEATIITSFIKRSFIDNPKWKNGEGWRKE